jgi:LIVCS family branched-chain amino acid:cation transporter
MTLVGSLLLTFFVSTFEFTGISAFLGPILQITYPGLIVLTFLNIAYRLKDFKPIKVPVFCAFALSAFFYFFQG